MSGVADAINTVTFGLIPGILGGGGGGGGGSAPPKTLAGAAGSAIGSALGGSAHAPAHYPGIKFNMSMPEFPEFPEIPEVPEPEVMPLPDDAAILAAKRRAAARRGSGRLSTILTDPNSRLI